MEDNREASPDPASTRPDNLPAPVSPLIFDPVPVKPRHDGLSPDRQRAFIEHVADGLTIADAAHAVGVSVKSVYRLRRRADAAGFAAAWDAAMADRLKRIAGFAFDRVLTGTVKRTFYHGELINEEVVHSDRLLLWMLEKGHNLLGNDSARARVMEDWDAALDRLEEGEGSGGGRYRVWQDRDRMWLTNFPPPDGFFGYEESAPGNPDYARSLTEEEKEGNALRQERLRARAVAARDAFFGTADLPAPPRRKRRR